MWAAAAPAGAVFEDTRHPVECTGGLPYIRGMTRHPPDPRPLRLFTAPGESPDLLELLDTEVEVEEVASFDQIRAHRQPAVLYLSRGLLKGLDAAEWERLPEHVTVVASDSQARGEAGKAGRLFLSMEDFTGAAAGLRRVLRAAMRHSAALLEARR